MRFKVMLMAAVITMMPVFIETFPIFPIQSPTRLKIGYIIRNAQEISSSETSTSTSTVMKSAAVIAGTTIGGGFLSLPHVTAPAGMMPSSVALISSWLYLLSTSFALTKVIFIVQRNQSPQERSMNQPISIFRVAKTCFGPWASIAVGIVFSTLMLATMVAQTSKIGALASQLSIFGVVVPKAVAIIAFISAIGGLCYAGGPSTAERCNLVLTSIMFLSFAGMIFAAGGAGWTPLPLMRGDWSQLVPFGGGPSHRWAVPTILQLLVYSETIPLVCSRLGDETRARRAILLGSIPPLLMCLLWTGIALGICSAPITGGAGVATAVALRGDPVDRLLQSSSWGLAYAVRALALSAIATTAIGSVLAMTQFGEDMLAPLLRGRHRHSTSNSNGNHDQNAITSTSVEGGQEGVEVDGGGGGLVGAVLGGVVKDWCLRWAPRVMALVPAAAVACTGSSGLYYAATHFAGAFPVTLLWGVFPPLALLRLWLRGGILRDPKGPGGPGGLYGGTPSFAQVASTGVLLGVGVVMLVLNLLLASS